MSRSGTQLEFGFQDADARLAFPRLGKTLEGVGAPYGRVAVSNVYPLPRSIAGLVRKVAPEFYDRAKPPEATAGCLSRHSRPTVRPTMRIAEPGAA